MSDGLRSRPYAIANDLAIAAKNAAAEAAAGRRVFQAEAIRAPLPWRSSRSEPHPHPKPFPHRGGRAFSF
jgi:hypothetical protein